MLNQINYLLKECLHKLGIKSQARSVAYWFEDLFYEDVLLKNKSLENTHDGEKCFIFGNGVSVNDIDMSLLTAEYTFGSNHLHYHKDFHKLNVNCYVMVSSYLELSRQTDTLYLLAIRIN